MLHGIDVSPHQSSFDTDGPHFVFIRTTEGRSYVNAELAGQTKRVRDAGFYHFLWPGHVKDRAAYFVSTAPEKPGDLLAVDWERTGEGTYAGNADKDCSLHEVKRLRPHHRALLYCNRSFWLNHGITLYTGDGLRIADYVTAGRPRVQAAWRVHQYTDHPLDMNVADFPSRRAMRDRAAGA